ncbi:DUF6084 family protein [Streptomyces sp. NPDC003247]|uniref:DUF6084 family protein n=1 Tax=Streptomyces sp. NPDC003247 TaxID=3364677 RepID=UPI0036A8C16E
MTAPPALSAPAAPVLAFTVTGAEEERFAALPVLRFDLEITRTAGRPVGSVALTTVVRIDVARRRYRPEAREALGELFGEPEQWAAGMRPLVWARTTVHVPAFDDRTTVHLPVECSYDTELAVTKYLRAVGDDGDVPLDFLFSGTVFHRTPDGPGLVASRVSWADGDTRYDLPAALWHSLTDRYHAGSPWLRLTRATYDRLDAYRARHVLTTPDDAVRALLDGTAHHHSGTSST